MRYRTDYSAQSLSSEPDILLLDGWQLRYQAFAAQQEHRRARVVGTGGEGLVAQLPAVEKEDIRFAAQ